MASKGNGSKHPASVWALRGIEPETRTAVAKAARRAGMTVGEWCNRALRDAATETLKEAPPPAVRLEDMMGQLLERMSAIEQARKVPFWKRWFRSQ